MVDGNEWYYTQTYPIVYLQCAALKLSVAHKVKSGTGSVIDTDYDSIILPGYVANEIIKKKDYGVLNIKTIPEKTFIAIISENPIALGKTENKRTKFVEKVVAIRLEKGQKFTYRRIETIKEELTKSLKADRYVVKKIKEAGPSHYYQYADGEELIRLQ